MKRERSPGEVYDIQAENYVAFAEESYPWKYIERPAIDAFASYLYKPEIKVLDVGCGTGKVMRHVASQGILPENIVAFDPSQKMVDEAKIGMPHAVIFRASLTDFELSPGSIDLAIVNMVFQYLDNKELKLAMDRLYNVLSEAGRLVFTMPHPLHNFYQGIDEGKWNKWVKQDTPWGTTVPNYHRDPVDFVDIFYRCGFNLDEGWVPLEVDQEGRSDTKKYERYTAFASRIGARLRKCGPEEKDKRNSNLGVPDLLSGKQKILKKPNWEL